MSPQNRLKWLLVTQKCQKFPGASPLDPIGGLTAPPNPQLLGLASLVFLAMLVFLALLALLATLVNISYFFNYVDLHPCFRATFLGARAVLFLNSQDSHFFLGGWADLTRILKGVTCLFW